MSQDSFKNSWYSNNYTSQPSKGYSYTDFDNKSSSNNDPNQSSNEKKYQSYSSFQTDNYKQNNFQSKQQQYNFDQSSSNYQNQNRNYNQQSQNQSNINFFSNIESKKQNNYDSYQSNNQRQQVRQNYQQPQKNSYTSNTQNIQKPQYSNQKPQPLRMNTIRDILQIPQERQQYLKTLSQYQLNLSPQYKILFNQPNVVLGIADYYQKIIPNPQLNKKIKSIRRTKNIQQGLYITSLISYAYLTGKMSYPGSTFKGIFKGKSHLLIPVGLTALMLFQSANTNRKTNDLVNNKSNIPYLNVAVKKFLCDADRTQKMQIFSQS